MTPATAHTRLHADTENLALAAVRAIAHGDADAAHVCSTEPADHGAEVARALVHELATIAALACHTVARLTSRDVDEVLDVLALDTLERWG